MTKAADVVVDRTLTGLVASAPAISPNGDGVSDGLTLSFALTQNVPVRVDVQRAGAVVATPFQGQPGSARTRSTGTARERRAAP